MSSGCKWIRSLAFVMILVVSVTANLSGGPAPTEDGIAGPFATLVIANTTVIDGTGSRPFGPVDVVIRGDTIAAIETPPSAARTSADCVYDATDEYLTPGFIDMHVHIADPRFGVPAEYQYLLWLVHGITTVRDAGCIGREPEWWLEQRERSDRDEIVAPRIFAYLRADDRRRVLWAADEGFDGVKIIHATDLDEIGAIIAVAHEHGMRVMSHNSTPYPIDVLAATGLDTMEHWYGLPESLSGGALPMVYDDVYQLGDEQDYFRYCGTVWKSALENGSETWVPMARELVADGLVLVPTLSVYAACADLEKARNAAWHDAYTLPALWASFQPNRDHHASHWYDWTTLDEIAWKRNLRIWSDFLKTYHDQGGLVAIGTDCGFMYSVFGFSYIEHLEMLCEAGFSTLEVIECATQNGAIALERNDELGTVQVGKRADLLIYRMNPLVDLKPLYAIGKPVLDSAGRLETVYGLKITMKDGIAYGRRYLSDEVKRLVAEKKRD